MHWYLYERKRGGERERGRGGEREREGEGGERERGGEREGKVTTHIQEETATHGRQSEGEGRESPEGDDGFPGTHGTPHWVDN